MTESIRILRIANKITKSILLANIDPVFSIEDMEESEDTIKNGLQRVVPFLNITHSTLGGNENISITIKLSLDPKEDWYNGIYQNSRYSMFMFKRNGVLEQFSMGQNIPKKFRKSRVKSVDDVISKITKYIKIVG